MKARILRNDAQTNNENLPGALLDPAEIAFAEHAAARAVLKPGKAMTEGLVSSKPFALRSFVNGVRMVPAEAQFKPTVQEGHLSFIGSGEGGSVIEGGSLISDPAQTVLAVESGFTFVAAFRCPSDGGGAIIGNALNQSRTYNTSTNFRYSGLTLGWGTSSGTEDIRCCLNGDSLFANPAGTGDFRDGEWHIAVGVFDHALQRLRVRVDRGDWADIDTRTSGGADKDISTVGGAQQIRIGATGLPGAAPEYGFKGDIGSCWVAAAPLSGDVLDNIELRLISEYRG
ncbi:hypothetical protein J7426_22985 [Tropicibacter sp. R16_0]|uniref:hypothetical protein n=1 Tax=Tropicibacter sp. R16_0 TaxID=2821102 RepID=UPI001ADB0C91|nr:hypothetical protein [Tropicibacter sp. R16_0]MBO9453146.1 hypothetical protein [Tropicibacter sp. R16_0]